MNQKSKVFWFHYNKPASSKAGKPQITVHQSGVCHIVDNVVVDTFISGFIRKDQPRFVLKGRGVMTIRENVAYIV